MSLLEDDLEPVNILLVDDRPSNLSSLEAILRRPDYNLVLARSGSEALGHVLRQEFAVILLDVAMPGMDGFETATVIKEREQSKLIPIIFVTASVYDMEHIFRGYTVGAVDYLRKPVDPHQVRAKVAVFVELYRQRRQLERQAIRLREAELREQRLLRERAEEALRESEAIYQHTFEQAPIGIGHASPEGRWIKANLRLCEILGHRRGEVVGQRICDMAVGADAQALAAALAQLEAQETDAYVGEHRLVTPRGVAIWGHVTISALRDRASQVSRLVVVIEDISERKQVEVERAELVEALQEAIRARDDFLSIAAHELKTPITPLRLQTSGLLREIAKAAGDCASDRLARRLKTIDRSSFRLESLIDRLLDVSRLRAGRLSLELEEVNLGALASEVIHRLADDAEHSGSTVELRISGPAIGRWDRLRIDQVLTNLLSNAIKYGEGKPIEVEVSAAADVVQLAVRDHGIGIPAGEQERIFERFERLVPVRHYGGFGLGLWIVRQIVEAHGGCVAVWSRSDEGSEFKVELPCEPVLAEVPDEAARDERAPGYSEIHS